MVQIGRNLSGNFGVTNTNRPNAQSLPPDTPPTTQQPKASDGAIPTTTDKNKMNALDALAAQNQGLVVRGSNAAVQNAEFHWQRGKVDFNDYIDSLRNLGVHFQRGDAIFYYDENGNKVIFCTYDPDQDIWHGTGA